MKKPTLAKQTSAFVYDLSPSLNNQRLITRTPQLSEISSTVGKLTKALPDPPLFTNEKDQYID